MSPKEKLAPAYRCRCCNWMSARRDLCPTCANGCFMHPERRAPENALVVSPQDEN